MLNYPTVTNPIGYTRFFISVPLYHSLPSLEIEFAIFICAFEYFIEKAQYK